MLSDGVFAIAMTLMALDIHIEPHADPSASGILAALAPSLVVFFWSFFATAGFWATHRRLMQHYSEVRAGLIPLNLVFLGGVVLIPTGNRMLFQESLSPSSIAVYVGLLAALGGVAALLWLHATLIARVVRPAPGPFRIAIVTAIQVLVPSGMAALGIHSALPGEHWLGFLIPPAAAGVGLLRRGANWLDARVAAPAEVH